MDQSEKSQNFDKKYFLDLGKNVKYGLFIMILCRDNMVSSNQEAYFPVFGKVIFSKITKINPRLMEKLRGLIFLIKGG